MPGALLPLRFLLLVFAGFVNREQAKVVDYLREENRVLREQIGTRRLRLSNEQRARLAAKPKAIGRSALEAVATIVTPEGRQLWECARSSFSDSTAGGQMVSLGEKSGLDLLEPTSAPTSREYLIQEGHQPLAILPTSRMH